MSSRNFAFLLSAVLLAAASTCASAQSGNFSIIQHGKPVGTATFNFVSTARGYDSTSMVRVVMQGLDYALSKTELLTAANHLENVQLNATINNSAVSVTGVPDAAQILLNISADGRSYTTHLAPHPAAVFLPDFDPGAFETLLALAITQNSRDLWAIIPKQTGSLIGSIVPVQLATYADEQGALDGKAISVHHLKATIAGVTTDLFSGPENQLLQAELTQQGFALVRKGFILSPPVHPGAPAVE